MFVTVCLLSTILQDYKPNLRKYLLKTSFW